MNPAFAVAAAAAFVWLGMVLAISFIEAPLKFRAPGVTLAIGLGIGRLVFRALNVWRRCSITSANTWPNSWPRRQMEARSVKRSTVRCGSSPVSRSTAIRLANSKSLSDDGADARDRPWRGTPPSSARGWPPHTRLHCSSAGACSATSCARQPVWRTSTIARLPGPSGTPSIRFSTPPPRPLRPRGRRPFRRPPPTPPRRPWRRRRRSPATGTGRCPAPERIPGSRR